MASGAGMSMKNAGRTVPRALARMVGLVDHGAIIKNRYKAELWRPRIDLDTGIVIPELVWEDDVHNLVVTEGRNHYLNVEFKGTTPITSWYVGLTQGSPSVAAGDTLASHGGWVEEATYTGNRKALTLGTVSAGSVDNSASKASFAITGSVTIGGAFVASVGTGTSGTLHGGGAFTGGNRSALSGDTLDVTVTLSITSS